MSSSTIQKTGVLPTDISNKKDVLIAWRAGVFGNRLQTWETPDEITQSGYRGPVRVRAKFVDAPPIMDKPFGSHMAWYIPHWAKVHGINLDNYIFTEVAPDDKCVFQGEITTSEYHYDLRYSVTPNLSMKEALQGSSELFARGLRAWSLMKHFLDPSSLDDVRELLDAYPRAVIEFGTYRCNLGNRRCRNTLIWEVRERY